MGSWVYNGFKVNLKLQSEEADTSSYISNPEWELLGAPAERHEIIYECCPEPYIGEYEQLAKIKVSLCNKFL